MKVTPEIEKTAETNSSPAGVYRRTSAVVCATCWIQVGDDHLLSPTTGEVQCRRCFDTQASARAAAQPGEAGDAFVGERRCSKCSGVASASEMVDHSVNVHYVMRGIPVGTERIETGSDTVFRCSGCGHQFVLLNRVRKL